ncbi:MAG: hypothetical protein H0X38_00865 [Planctomycetes bacterium]|nr:hypothetical protein [Planctomycetota bacterium]
MNNAKKIIDKYAQKFLIAAGEAEAVNRHLSDFRQEFSSSVDFSDEINEMLSSQTEGHEDKNISLLLMAAYFQQNKKYIINLCKLLSINSNVIPYENLVEILEELADPYSIPFLKKKIDTISGHRDALEIASKCIDALASIDTTESWAAIGDISRSESIVKNEAAQALKWHK